MTFRSVFISVVLGSTLIIAALIFNAKRPAHETNNRKPNLSEALASAQRAIGRRHRQSCINSSGVVTPKKGLTALTATAR